MPPPYNSHLFTTVITFERREHSIHSLLFQPLYIRATSPQHSNGHQSASRTTKITSPQWPVDQQMTNDEYKNPLFIAKGHKTWSVQYIVDLWLVSVWFLFYWYLLIVLGISVLQWALFCNMKILNPLEKKPHLLYLHPYLPIMATSQQQPLSCPQRGCCMTILELIWHWGKISV